jgi:hypothetical protein
MIVFLLVMVLFICGWSYHRRNEKPKKNINKEEEEKQEHIPDTTDPIILNRF